MFFHDVPLECINYSATTFQVPASIIVSVIKTEGGWNGATIKNKNGSYDLGVMQINTIWLSTLKKYGITKENLQNNPCTNVHVGTWILSKGLSKSADWKGVGNYHSATPQHNKRYREKVKSVYERFKRVVGRN